MTIFHVIDSLERGGAEILLLNVIRKLHGHKNYLVTLNSANKFGKTETEGIEIISLGVKSMLSVPRGVLKLRRLIARHQPDILHAHLPFSSLVARLAKPAGKKMFVSIHNYYSQSLKPVSPRLFLLEKKLHSSRDRLIFVSQAAKTDYEELIGIKGPAHVLHNFIGEKFFDAEATTNQRRLLSRKTNPVRLVSVGQLKYQKNYDTLIRAMALVDPAYCTLDIYGEGGERKSLQDLVDELRLTHVTLKGSSGNIDKVLAGYDAFVLASRYEGFGLAPIEAAALGLPLLLSDLAVFREITMGNALFFVPDDVGDMAGRINSFLQNPEPAVAMARQFKSVVKEQYSVHGYIDNLTKIYNS